MKKLKTQFLIPAGFLLAILLTSAGSIASTLSNENFEITEAYYMDMLESKMDKEAYQLMENIAKLDHCCKIYNSNNELVYMSRDKNDERLCELKKRCDLIMKTDSSSYYLLGD